MSDTTTGSSGNESSRSSSNGSSRSGTSTGGSSTSSNSDTDSGTDGPSVSSRRRTSRVGSRSSDTDAPNDQSEGEGPSRQTDSRLEPRGMGLRTKLILLVLVAQVFAAAFIYFVSLPQIRDALKDEIDQRGTTLVRIFSKIKPDFLKEIQGNQGRPSSELKDKFKISTLYFQQLLSLANELGGEEGEKQMQSKLEELKPKIQDDIDDAFDRLTRTSTQSDGFLGSIVDSKSPIMAAYFRYLREDGTPYEPIYYVPQTKKGDPPTMGADDTHIRTIPLNKGQKKGDIKISESTLNEAPVRKYKLTTPLPDSNRKYQILLFLSAEDVEKAAGQLTYTLLIVTLLSVVCGGVAGWVFSGQIIHPINSLLDDINTVSQGNLDHKTIPESKDEIGVIARTFNRMTNSLKEAQKRELEAKAMEHELNIAMEVQNELLPEENPDLDNWDIGSFYKPSKEVGGDYYDFIRIDEDHLGVVVADVSGKGVPGSLVMTMTRAMIRMEANRSLSTKETLIRTNRMLAKDIREGMFVTCMYGILNIPESTLRISSAGHNPMVIWRQKEEQVRKANPNGIALGFDEGPLFERTIEEKVVHLNKGDRFVIYTDGIVESMSPDEEEFGEERFFKLTAKLAQKDSDQLTEAILKSLAKHQGDADQHDDITILTARRME